MLNFFWKNVVLPFVTILAILGLAFLGMAYDWYSALGATSLLQRPFQEFALKFARVSLAVAAITGIGIGITVYVRSIRGK
jgi:hypothetical protein